MENEDRITRLKKTWLYPFFAILVVAFSTILYQRTIILAAISRSRLETKVETQREAENTIVPEAKAEVPVTIVKKEDRVVAVNTNKQDTSNKVPMQNPVVEEPRIDPPVVIEIKETTSVAIEGLGTFEILLEKDDNGFIALEKACFLNGFSLDYSEDPTWGAFVKGIGGVENKDPNYWTLYYNGIASSVGASQIVLNNGDKTEWRYESWSY